MTDVIITVRFVNPSYATPLQEFVFPLSQSMFVDVPPGTPQMHISARLSGTGVAPASEDTPEFKEHVLAWLKDATDLDATEVVEVRGYGTDIEDTDDYTETRVMITYRNSSDIVRDYDVEGEEFASLWHWVVGSWKSPQGSYPPPEIFSGVPDE